MMSSSEIPGGWGFRPRTVLGEKHPTYSEDDHARARALYATIIGMYGQVSASGSIRADRIWVFPRAVLQHFQGFLLGEQSLEHLLSAVSTLGAWTGFPPALRAAFVGMCAEAALEAPLRKRKPTKRAEHLMFSGGALVESLMFDEAGVQVMVQGDAITRALPMLREMGQADGSVDAKQLRDWHARYRKREELGPLQRGRRPAA